MSNIQLKRSTTPGQAIPAGALAGEPLVNLADEKLVIAKGDGTSFEVSTDLSNYDTSAEVDAKVAAVVDTAPATLDTLNELASALNDDANFATTVTNSIATKEDTTNKSTDVNLGTSDTLFPTQNAVKSYVDANAGGGGNEKTFELDEAMTAGDLVQILNDGKATGIVQETTFPASSGTTTTSDTVSLGDILTISSVQIDENRVFVTYKDKVDGNGKARILTVSGTTVTYGNSVNFGGVIQGSDVEKLDTNKVFIAYLDSGSDGNGVIATISGDVITIGTSYEFNYTTQDLSVTKIDTNKVFIAYNGDYRGRGIVATISGTVISYGGAAQFPDGSSTYFKSVAAIDTNKVLISWNSSYNTYAVVATISGTTITYGNLSTLEAGNTFAVSVTKLDTDKAIIAFQHKNNNYYGTAVVATISGTTITYGTKFVFKSSNCNRMDAVKISTDKVGIVYHTSSYLYYTVLNINGTTITTDSTSATADYGSASIALTSDGKVVIPFANTSDDLSYIVKEISYTATAILSSDTAGILQESGNAGESKSVMLLGGISATHTGLTPGVTQFIQDDGSIGTTSTSYKLGRAVSSTEINTGQNNI